MPLSCPHCGKVVRDGALTCPYCHASLDVTQRLSLSDASWCPDCGALLAPGARSCPKCGRVMERGPARRVRSDMDLPDIGGTGDLSGAERTGAMTRIESAIPSVSEGASAGVSRDHMPRPRAFAFAAIFALFVVGGATLLITHPWDPTATITRASEPADTSMSGFPGVVDTLSGQDSSSDVEDRPATDPFDAVLDAHAQLADLEAEVGESEDALRSALEAGDSSGLQDGLESAQSVSLHVSNLISNAALLDDDDGAYAQDLENIQTLGNWLRNRCDALTSAWQQAVDAADLTSAADSITATLDGASDYERLFDQNYDAWTPAHVEEE